jgi:hypothetical protein
MFVSPMSASPRAAAGRGARLGGRAAWQLPVHDPLLEPATRSLTPRWTTGSGGDPRVAGTCAPRGGRRRSGVAQAQRLLAAMVYVVPSADHAGSRSCARTHPRSVSAPRCGRTRPDSSRSPTGRGQPHRRCRSDEETPRKAMGSEYSSTSDQLRAFTGPLSATPHSRPHAPTLSPTGARDSLSVGCHPPEHHRC